MTIEAVSDIGLLRNLGLRLGDTFGPFRVELFDAAQAVAALPGATVGGDIWPRAAPGTLTPLSVAFSDGTNTAVDYYLAAATTAGLGGAGSYFKAAQSYGYRVWYQEAGGVRRTLVYGVIDIASGTPTG